MICMSLDLIFISKRAINFHPFISIRVNGITFHCSGQPRTVTSSHKYAAPKKDKKAKLNPFLIKRFKRNSKLKMIIIYFYRYGTCNNNNNNNNSKNLRRHVESLGIKVHVPTLQKLALLGTAIILRNVLSA